MMNMGFTTKEIKAITSMRKHRRTVNIAIILVACLMIFSSIFNLYWALKVANIHSLSLREIFALGNLPIKGKIYYDFEIFIMQRIGNAQLALMVVIVLSIWIWVVKGLQQLLLKCWDKLPESEKQLPALK